MELHSTTNIIDITDTETETDQEQNANARMVFDNEENIEMQESIDRALNTSLIVDKICSFMRDDLSTLRLVNNLFHFEATKHVRVSHKPINLQDESVIKHFIASMTPRVNKPDMFPFTNFNLDLKNKNGILHSLLEVIGPHARRYSYVDNVYTQEEALDGHQLGSRLKILLSASPNLTEIYLRTFNSSFIYTSEPTDFKLNNLRRVDIDYRNDLGYMPAGSNSLLCVLAERVGRSLDTFRIPSVYGVGFQRSLQMLRPQLENQNVRQRLNFLSTFLIYRKDVSITALELNTFGNLINFKELSLELYGEPSEEVSAVLTNQTARLSSLTIEVKNKAIMYLDLPPFTALTKLNFGFPDYINDNSDLTVILVKGTMTVKDLPRLKILQLMHYREDYEIFNSPLPTVRKLHLHKHKCLLTDPWQNIFPNLTTLHIQIVGSCSALNIDFILTRFLQLIELDLEILSPGYIYETMEDCWSILTGQAPRPTDNDELFNGSPGTAGELEEPVDGTFKVASLRNFRALKKFRFTPRVISNLNAIVYLSRAKLLVPLDVLILDIRRSKISVDELDSYRTVLAQFHKEVSFVTKI